jgi:hypothetical protein
MTGGSLRRAKPPAGKSFCVFPKALLTVLTNGGAGVLLLISIFLGGSLAHAQDQIIHGTVNVVLGNANGIVVLTDSDGTLTDDKGNKTTQISQKLVRFNGRSVFAIAGFGSANIAAGLEFNVDIVGIISDFRDQLTSRGGSLSFEEELRALSFVIQLFIQGYANILEVLEPGKLSERDLYLSLLVAGVDSDGKSKIGSLQLTAKAQPLSPPNLSWQFTEDIDVESVDRELKGCVRGMWDVGRQILKSPQPYATNPAIRKYIAAAPDKGASLSVDDLEAIAKLPLFSMARQRDLSSLRSLCPPNRCHSS